MQEEEIRLPKLGESILSATLVRWFKKEGEKIERDQPLAEVSTDKVSSEIPSPLSGTITKIWAHVDQELEIGALLATISAAETCQTRAPLFSPAILHLAQQHQIGIEELNTIATTGAEGRLTRRDVESYLVDRKNSQEEIIPPPSSPPPSPFQRIKMSRMRKAIADNTSRSFYSAPHATLIAEVESSSLIELIASQKEPFRARYGAKLTITSLIAHAICQTLPGYPFLNSSIEGEEIVIKPTINLGIAVSIDHGLLVPVIKNCHTMDVATIAQKIEHLSSRARSGTLSPEETAEGSITLTNFGMTGISIGIPIIRHPEVAILGIGAVTQKVFALDNKTLQIGSSFHISLTFDHRVIDGIYGCHFLSSLKEKLSSKTSL